ncbi:MAG: hypothetical protein RQ753_09520, partial [Desulfurivibrionaceae bacterium]|nr:hypothetical protein [Desulfurivibrionaceae bacterium]
MKNRKWKWNEVVGTLLFILALPGMGSAAVQTKIYQCANYKAGTGDHDTCENWVTGNLNEQKAFYFEGDSVAYRLHIVGLSPGESYTATIEWDGTEGAKNALDYLTTVSRTVANADPCQDLAMAGCDKDWPDDTYPIPVDPDVENGRDRTAGTADDIDQETPHSFRIWNGDITGVGSYVYDPAGFDYLSTTKISVPITFTATASQVVLAWGGHISTRMDWGEAYSAINISGSPYHMRLLTVVDDVTDDIVASGNRDLQLSASAVFFPISLTIEKSTDRDTSAYFDFTTSLPAPDNTFQLQSCVQSSENCTISLEVGESTVSVTEVEPGALWDLESIVCDDLNTAEPNDQGFTSIDSGLGASLTMAEGAVVKCTFHNLFVGEPLLVVEKKVIEASGSCGTVDFDNGSTDELLEIASGDTVKYCYRVKNTGDVAAYNVTLRDDAGGLAISFPVPLSGGDIANLDSGGSLNDLDIDSQSFGEALVTIGEPTGTTVTNTGEADADNADPASDTAEVEVVDRADCTLTATVTETTCPGATNTIDVVAGTGVTWCA